MLSRPIRKVAVIGAGLMGAGIGQVAALGGFHVSIVDSDEGALEGGGIRVVESLARLVRSGKLPQECADAAQGRLSYGLSTEAAVCDADMVIEAIVEALAPKQALFETLGNLCAPDTILATNTSQFSIGLVAERCANPERTVGMHFSNPPPLMSLVEVILSDRTSEHACATVLQFLADCGKAAVICRKDVPGFISNRLSIALFMEAVRLVEEGVAEPREIDDVARLMFGHRMGPIATLDLAGLDTALRTASALSEHYGGDRFAPPRLLAEMVATGSLGRKSGAGFYEYRNDPEPERAPRR